MRVEYIGELKRVNSFGVFEPGKIYDVSAEVGEQLLSAPNLFRLVESGMRRSKNASTQIVDVKGDGGGKYDNITNKILISMLMERGIETRRGARKAELITLMEKADVEDKEKADAEDKAAEEEAKAAEEEAKTDGETEDK